MNKTKDRTKAESGQPFRNVIPAPKGKKWIKCVYPPCQNQVLIEDMGPLVTPQPMKTPPFCQVHMELVKFVMWLTPQIQVKQGETPHGLVLPGSPQFGLKP